MNEESMEKNFSTAFAVAWDESQGGYSENIAKKECTINTDAIKNNGFVSSPVTINLAKRLEPMGIKVYVFVYLYDFTYIVY